MTENKTTAEVQLDAMELLRGTFERTPAGYAALLKSDALRVLAGDAGEAERRHPAARFWNNAQVRDWGKTAFPDFKLTPEDLQEVEALAAALHTQ